MDNARNYCIEASRFRWFETSRPGAYSNILLRRGLSVLDKNISQKAREREFTNADENR